MESDRRLRNFRGCLYLFAGGMALQGGVDLYRSTRDMFPQQRLPSLGATADTTIRILQERLHDQYLLAGLQLVACACIVTVAVLLLSRATGARGTPGG